MADTLTPGTKIRFYGTGKLARRTSPATVLAATERAVSIRTDSGNVLTIGIERVKR